MNKNVYKVKVRRKGKENARNVWDPEQTQKAEQKGNFHIPSVFPIYFNPEWY